MSKESLVQRMLTSEARIDAQRLRKGLLRDDDFPRLARAAGILGTAPVWIDDTPGITLLEMRSKARRLKTESGIGLVIVDYLQLMQGPTHAESRQQEVSQISRGLKALAKELNVPVIALSQLSRAPEQRTGDNKRPQLSDLRESGAIEQDADLIMFLYRQEFYDGPTDKDGNSLEGKAEVIVGKQRNGPTGLVNLFFHKQYTRFESYSQKRARAACEYVARSPSVRPLELYELILQRFRGESGFRREMLLETALANAGSPRSGRPSFVVPQVFVVSAQLRVIREIVAVPQVVQARSQHQRQPAIDLHRCLPAR